MAWKHQGYEMFGNSFSTAAAKLLSENTSPSSPYCSDKQICRATCSSMMYEIHLNEISCAGGRRTPATLPFMSSDSSLHFDGWVSGGLSEVRGVAASLAANGMGFPHSVNRQGRGQWTRDKDRHLQGTRPSEGCARKCRVMVLCNSGSVSVHIRWL